MTPSLSSSRHFHFRDHAMAHEYDARKAMGRNPGSDAHLSERARPQDRRVGLERSTEMKYLIMLAATFTVFSGFALAREHIVGSDLVGQASRDASATRASS